MLTYRKLAFFVSKVFDFREEIGKPWTNFRKSYAVFDLGSKITFKKVSFSLFRFFWTSKRNENPSDNVTVRIMFLIE